MNQDQEQQQQEEWVDPHEEHVIKPGDMLKQAREAKKITIDDVAKHLRLRKQLIEELEENKFDPKVAGTFTRGYLRSYAKFLELPEQEVIDAYYALGFEAPRKDAMQSFSRKKSRETQDNRLMLITWIIAAILVASVILFAWQKSGEEEMESRLTPNGAQDPVVEVDPAQAFSDQDYQGPSYTAESGTDSLDEPRDQAGVETRAESSPNTQTTNRAAESQPERTSGSEAQQQSPASNEPTQTTREQTTPVQQQRPTPTVAEPERPTERAEDESRPATGEVDPTAAELVLHFRGDCWVRIDDAEGNTLAFGVKQAGYTMPLNGVQPYSLTIGAPHLVDVYFQGEAVDLSGLREGRVARLNVPDA